jgi:hypothetical protein
MNERIRESLPRSVNTRITTWLRDQPWLPTVLPAWVAAMTPFVNEAIVFGLRNHVLEYDHGRFRPGFGALNKKPGGDSDDVIACQKAATFLGRWLALGGPPATVSALLGVRP